MNSRNTFEPVSRFEHEDGNTRFAFHLRDCVGGMGDLVPDGSVDLVVTSPPYNLGIAYGKYDDTLEREDYLQWSKEWAGAVRRALKPDGALFLNVGAAPKNPYLPHELVLRLRDLFVLQNTFHWIKSISVETKGDGLVSAGHFKPINSKRYVNDCHEYLFHLTKAGDVPVERKAVGVPYEHKSNIGRWGHTGGEDLRCRGNNWFIPYRTIMSRSRERPHPATFPVELASRCIRLHGKGAATVMLEPFLGIGHSALAARECAVKSFTGFEIDADYFATACERISERNLL